MLTFVLRLPLALALAAPASAAVSEGSPGSSRGEPADRRQALDPDPDPDPDPAPTQTRIVLAISTRSDLQPAALELTLRGHLSDLALSPQVELRGDDDGLRGHLEWARQSIDSGAEAVFWLEQPRASAATLYLLLDKPERLYMRALTLSEEPLESQEILGVVIRGQVTSLAKRIAPPDMEEVPLPGRASEPDSDSDRDGAATSGESNNKPVQEDMKTAKPRLLLGLGYAGSSYAAALPWGHGVGLSVGLLGARGLALTVDASWSQHGVLTPAVGEARYDDARLRLGRGGLGLRLGYRVALGSRRRVFIEPALAVRGEALSWWPVRPSRALRGIGVRVSAGPATTAGVYLGRGFGLSLTAGLDVWLRNLDLVATTPAGSVPIARPSTLGASILTGLIYVR